VSADIYRRLASHLDNLPGGFPSTESGVELRILERLFTPEEAELALHLQLVPNRLVSSPAGPDSTPKTPPAACSRCPARG